MFISYWLGNNGLPKYFLEDITQHLHSSFNWGNLNLIWYLLPKLKSPYLTKVKNTSKKKQRKPTQIKQ